MKFCQLFFNSIFLVVRRIFLTFIYDVMLSLCLEWINSLASTVCFPAQFSFSTARQCIKNYQIIHLYFCGIKKTTKKTPQKIDDTKIAIWVEFVERFSTKSGNSSFPLPLKISCLLWCSKTKFMVLINTQQFTLQ